MPDPRSAAWDSRTTAAAETLLRADLTFTRSRWREPCFDIWEEELGTHYYTLCVAAAALDEGAVWLDARGEAVEARACRGDAAAIRGRLDAFWLEDEGFYRSRALASGERSAKELDISVVLAAIHANAAGPRHSVHDPRILATLARLDALFDAEYPINRQRPVPRGPALGRYRGDVYYSGGAYYFSTLGAAELCFRAAAGTADPAARRALVVRGDAYLETVRAFTPPSGDLSEQFDQRTGEQTSAKHLAWSYAALVTCITARGAAARDP
jgi:glucoamylase